MNWQSQYSMTQGQMRIYNTNKKPLESLHRFEGLQVLKTSMFYFPSFFWRSISLSSTRRILPEIVLGRLSTNSISRGYL